jgi:hypothetical protein
MGKTEKTGAKLHQPKDGVKNETAPC